VSFSARSVALYDAIYSRKKDYAEEAGKIRGWIQRVCPGARSALDVGCGTAEHARHLKAHYAVDGLDLNPAFLDVARAKNPECGYFQGDMTSFSLGRRYDVVMSLFSCIGYVRTRANLARTFRCFREHLAPGGAVIVEPWFTPEQWHPGKPHAMVIDEPDFKVCRMNTTMRDGDLSWFDFHYLVATPAGVEHFTERHELALFTRAETESAFAEAGLRAEYDEAGIFGRGLYVARAAD
jgi:SAM-dependent methyltransferase